MLDEVEVDTKTVEPEKPTLSLDQFLNQSFECVFNQNVHLHRALAQVLQEEFKKLKDQNSDLEDKIDTLEKKFKRRIFTLYKRNYERIRCIKSSRN